MDTLDQKLRAVVAQYESLQAELALPATSSDPDALRRLGRELAALHDELAPHVEGEPALGAGRDLGRGTPEPAVVDRRQGRRGQGPLFSRPELDHDPDRLPHQELTGLEVSALGDGPALRGGFDEVVENVRVVERGRGDVGTSPRHLAQAPAMIS